MVGEEGVVVYNLCAHSLSMSAVFKKQFEGIFTYVYMKESEDVNRVLIASNRPILEGEEIEQGRREWTKNYMKKSLYFVCLRVGMFIHCLYELYRRGKNNIIG